MQRRHDAAPGEGPGTGRVKGGPGAREKTRGGIGEQARERAARGAQTARMVFMSTLIAARPIVLPGRGHDPVDGCDGA